MGYDVFPNESFSANFWYEHGWVTVQNRTCPCTGAPTLVQNKNVSYTQCYSTMRVSPKLSE